jgi:hypothetical protein
MTHKKARHQPKNQAVGVALIQNEQVVPIYFTA